MIYFGMFALIIWLPVVFYIFESLPGPKAVVFSFIFAWLFLPTLQIGLSGIPDWSKMSATTFSVMLMICIKYPNRFASIRFQYYDLPVVIYCTCPILSSVMNSQGVYDGFSACLEETVRWGLPYLIGRLFLADTNGNYLLCLGIAIGGLVYAPLCLFEIRMSPILKLWVYGYTERGGLDFSMRYGGFRPIVFLSFGLETGWWMCCATLACYNLWKSGVVKRLWGFPISTLTYGMMGVTVLCKSTGALVLIIVGYLVFMLSRRTKTTILVWIVLFLPIFYCISRPFGLWSGASLVDLSSTLFGADRAQSLGFRFDQEEILMRSAMQRPIYGWSRFGGFNMDSPDGRRAATDGLWIIVFGVTGYIGLTTLIAMLILPTIVFMRRFRPQDWMTPAVAPTLTLVTILPLYMIDNLSNAMLNPVYAVAMGAVSGFVPRRLSPRLPRSSSQAGPGLSGPLGLSQADFASVQQPTAQDQLAAEHEAAALVAARERFNEVAWEQFNAALECRQLAVDLEANPHRLDQLARSSILFARFLSRVGYQRFAIEQRTQALQIWRSLLRQEQKLEEILPAHAANLNDLAWLWITDPGATAEQLAQAGTFVEEAVQLDPEANAYWNTLGVAYYRQQEYYKAIRALSQSVSLADDGGNAFDFYYLALANHALGYTKPSHDWLEHAESWAAQNPEMGRLLQKVQDEVTQTLGLPRRKQPV